MKKICSLLSIFILMLSLTGCGSQESVKTLGITPEEFAKNFNSSLGFIEQQFHIETQGLEIVSVEKGKTAKDIVFKQKNYSGSFGGIVEGSNLITILFATENNPQVAAMSLAIPFSVPLTRDSQMVQKVAAKIIGENHEPFLKENGVVVSIGQDSSMSAFFMTTEEDFNKQAEQAK